VTRFAVKCIAIFALAVASTADLQAQTTPFAKVLPSTVWIEYPVGTKTRFGTGSLVNREQRLVVTCLHVMENQKQGTVYFPMYRGAELMTNAIDYLSSTYGITGKVVAADSDRDLAILQLNKVPPTVPALEMADRAPPAGTPLFVLGNSTVGIKTIDQEKLWKQYSTKVNKLVFSMQTLENEGNKQVHTWAIVLQDKVNPGDSGGPAVNADGRLVGVTYAEDKDFGYAIDVEEVRIVLNRYLNRNSPRPQNPMTGKWTVQIQPREKPVGYFRMNFFDNGQVDWITDKTYTGKFELKDNQLALTIPGLNVNETLTITRTSDNQFSFTSAGVPFTFTRR